MIGFVRRQPFTIAFAAVVFGLVGLAASQMAARVPFRWDLYIWSESAFLTNVLKLDRGMPIYTSPDDANSFVYSPGLEYLTYAILKPFGLQLDIRFCRAVTIGMAVLASLALARCAWMLARAACPEPPGRLFGPIAASLFFLIIYRNFTSDVPHPDNLYILHVSVTLLLTFEAIARPSAWRSVLAILFAASGVYVKQMAALSAVGVALVLSANAPRRLRSASWMFPLGLVATATALGLLWGSGWAKFYTYDVLKAHADHGISGKIPALAADLFLTYRAIPLGLYAIALASGLRSRDGAVTRYLLAHLVIGGAEVAPSVMAYLKPMGLWNNLTIIEVWAALPPVALLLGLLRGDGLGEPSGGRPAWPIDFARSVAPALVLALALAYVPTKTGPEPAHHEHCRAIQEMVSRDIRAGKRVLVAHGLTFQLLGGSRQVPLDRSNSVLELNVAGKPMLAGTVRRIRKTYYDTIYLNSAFYSPYVDAVIAENYREIARIPGSPDGWVLRLDEGYNGLTVNTPVYVRR